MSDIKEQVLKRLESWARACRDAAVAERAFVFGSLIYDGGSQFIAKRSDVDLLIEVPSTLATPSDRLEAYLRLLPLNRDLESDLGMLLSRTDHSSPITSIVPVTAFELRFGIHKGGKPALYTSAPFRPLLDAPVPTVFERNSPLAIEKASQGVAAIELAQAYRNKFLAITADGSRNKEIGPWADDIDPVPKAMIRAAAQLRYYVECLADYTSCDMRLGLDFVYDLVASRRLDGPVYQELYGWFSVSRGGRGESSPLQAEQAVLLWEILAIEAERTLQDRERDIGGTGPVPPRPRSDDDPLVVGIERPYSSGITAFLSEYRQARFGGRDRELVALTEWLDADDSRPALLLGEAGRGKSALIVHWLDQVGPRGTHDVIFMPVSLRFETAHVAAVARSITGRLRHLRGSSKEAIPSDDPFVALDECRETFETGWARPLLVVLDGLDEATGWKVTRLIPRNVAAGIKFLVATRGPEEARPEWEARLGWHGTQTIVAARLGFAAVKQLIAETGTSLATASDKLIERFYALTDGDPLLVQLQLSLLNDDAGRTSLERLQELVDDEQSTEEPLKRFLGRWWAEQRTQWKESNVPELDELQRLLNLLACAQGAIGLADLCALTGWEGERVRDLLQHLRRLVIEVENGQRFVLGHSRLRDYFVDRLRETDTYESLLKSYVAYGNARFAELSAEHRSTSPDTFNKRFGYVLRHLALHLAESEPAELAKLMSRRWLDAWRKLDGEDGLYGGFYEDVSRAEAHARDEGPAGSVYRALIIKASITSLSSNVPPWLMRRLVETRLWPLSRALKIIDRMVDDDERASALGVLAGAVDEQEQGLLVERALHLPDGPRTRALGHMMADLNGPHKETAFSAILSAGRLFRAYSFSRLDQFASSLSPEFATRLLAAAENIDDPTSRVRVLIEIVSGAETLGIAERKRVLVLVEHDLAAITDVEQRARFRLDVAAAAGRIEPARRVEWLRSAWDEIRALDPHDDGTDSLLAAIADQLTEEDQALRTAVIEAMWAAIHGSSTPWWSVSFLGPRLASLGLAGRVFEYSETLKLNEHSRAQLLASLLPVAPELSDQVLERLYGFKRIEWALESIAYQVKSLTSEQRTAYIDKALNWVADNSERSFVIGRIAHNLSYGDANSQRIIAAAKKLPSSGKMAERLLECSHLVPPNERDELVTEVLNNVGGIEREQKQRLLAQAARLIRTNQNLLLVALEVSRTLNDEGLLATALDDIAVTLCEAGDVDGARALLERSARAFPQHETWGAESYLRILRKLDGEAKNAVWALTRDEARTVKDPFPAALFAVELAIQAPAAERQASVERASAAITKLDVPFQRSYAGIRQLALLDPEARNARIEEIARTLLAPASRRNLFQLVHELFSKLTPSERGMHWNALRPAVDRILRRATGDEPDNTGDETLYLDHVARFLDAQLVREETLKCPGSNVSSLDALGHRLAELGEVAEGIEAIRKIESPEQRAAGLARLLGFVPADARAALLAEARRDLAQANQPTTGEAESFLVDYVDEAERHDWILAALRKSLGLSSRKRRRETMRRLAESASKHLPAASLTAIWSELLEIVAPQRREEFVQDIDALLPVLFRVVGKEALLVVGHSLLDVGEWFP